MYVHLDYRKQRRGIVSTHVGVCIKKVLIKNKIRPVEVAKIYNLNNGLKRAVNIKGNKYLLHGREIYLNLSAGT